MRSLQLTTPGAPLTAVYLPDPAPGPGEVLVGVQAAGICHSDAHYRVGNPKTRFLPIILGHEIAGVIEAVGEGVDAARLGERVGVHYVVSDGTCRRCVRFGEQFCENYEMFGLTCHGGYAERVTVPQQNAVPVPDGVAIEHAAVMMCSSATSLHALRKGRLRKGESVAVFGVGGLGMSAVQLARALGAERVYGIDIDQTRLRIAADLGAIPLRADEDPSAVIQAAGGVDIALALVDKREAFEAAMASLTRRGRVVAVGIGRDPVPIQPYGDLILGEHELIGSNDHLLGEIRELFDLATRGLLRLDAVVTDVIPLGASPVNAALDRLDGFGPGIRTVIKP
jgi:propanol-preferring alcohol dehydrogenase